ncbi:hypothetical protein F5B20DRAFT_527491 [Whalleya microplaca]|nr:hypothetical protein F5B20DRAFT_527491 [Whalleya microplaca]
MGWLLVVRVYSFFNDSFWCRMRFFLVCCLSIIPAHLRYIVGISRFTAFRDGWITYLFFTYGASYLDNLLRVV